MSTESTSKRESLLQIYSDYHKDAYGFRPRYCDYSAYSLEQLEADFARFGQMISEAAEAEALAELGAVAAFKSTIRTLIEVGAGDEETALRWLASAGVEECGPDYEHYLWQRGILHTEYGRELGTKLAPIFNELYSQNA
jgi:hypothetical protein